MNTITFDLNCDNRPIVDKDFDSTNLNSRVFGAQYELALSQIDNYLSETTLYTISEDDVENNTDNINNIIAFVGDRGSGKTTCMLSVAELLRNKRRKDTFINFKFLKTTNFIFGGMIDPSYFDGKHNLVSLFVSKLYQKYVNEIPKLNIDTKEKNALYDSFSRAQRHLMIMLESSIQMMMMNLIDIMILLMNGV